MTTKIDEQTMLEEKVSSGVEQELAKLWDYYAREGYENIYLVRITKEHRQKLGELFLSANSGVCLDEGCGTGNMFELIVQRIKPKELHAVDWSLEMMEKAKLEAQRLQQLSDIEFKFYLGDIAKSLTWPDNFFDVTVSNLVICYLQCGWKKSIEELKRVIKPGGYLYMGTLLKEWSFTTVLWKHAPIEFLREPIRSLQGLKYRRLVAKISKELQKHGAEFPSQKELVDYLEILGFKDIKIIPTYWGGGIALRALKPPYTL